jgi:glycosyltransferase involved in cell wall biosynthesis
MVRVSVVTIFYNEERFLADAIASVRGQTLADWELILVDDGSTDRSPEIAREAAADDSRIKVVSHPNGENRGMSASRNRGFAGAKGEFIALLDADDVWAPCKLAEQIQILEAYPGCGMVYGHALIWRTWNPVAVEADERLALGVEPNRVYKPPTLFKLLMRNRAQSPMTSNTMIRRRLINEVGGFEESFRGMFEDQVFFVKAHLATCCYVSDAQWLLYRQHSGSCTASIAVQQELRALARFLRWTRGYLLRQPSQNWSLWPSVLFAQLDCRRRQLRALAGYALGRG